MLPPSAARSSTLPHGGFFWSAVGVSAATIGFWLAHDYLDKGQTSLLYLPVVIACAVRFGFGPAVLAASLSFLCWDYFFLQPAFTLQVSNPRDLLSLGVFLVVAVTTARLTARAQEQAAAAGAREAEMATLFEASESLSREVSTVRLLAALTQRLQTLCQATRCLVFRRDSSSGTGEDALALVEESGGGGGDAAGCPPDEMQRIRTVAEQALQQDPAPMTGGIVTEDWSVCVPLVAAESLVGVLYVGPRADGLPFSPVEKRLIRTLANHAATVLARDALTAQVAQAAARRDAEILKDALLSLVSHELRTPLAAIKASASGLLQPNAHWDDEAREETLASIDREADRLTSVVNNLLDLSRLEAGVWQPNKDWCDLSDVTATVLDRLPADAASRVVVDSAATLPLIRADYTQIALVLENLLGNAAKYVPGVSPIELTIRAQGSAEITVRVRDYGEGIVQGEETNIFARFVRGSRHARGRIHGTGLGLALCEAIVHAHGGAICAANAPVSEPSGAIFTVTLPL